MASSPRRAVIFLLDRSGSMKSIKASTIEAFNGYVADLRLDPQIEFTLIEFDTVSIDIVHRRLTIAEVPELTAETFQPRGGTPLIDAGCVAIKAAQAEYADGDQVVMTVLTDGMENASAEFKLADLHRTIKERSAAGWQFVFLGASIDVYGDAGRMGVPADATMSYDSSDADAATSALADVSRKTRGFFRHKRKVDFTDDEKRAAGDRFRPGQSLVDRLKL